MSTLLQFMGLEAVHLPAKPLHLAIGMFDGVHLGHQAVIAKAVDAAQAGEGISAALTFWPHPSGLFRPQDPTRLIMTPEAKSRVLARLGIEALITQPFTPEFAGVTAEDLLPEFRRVLPQLAAIYIGENWRFGRGRAGDVSLLKQMAPSLGIAVISMPRVRNKEDETISSTRIRELIESGEIEHANQLLGYPYFAEGRITPGKGMGRQIGFPTLNLNWIPELLPQYGVYAVRVRRDGETVGFNGVANYGVRPTVENTSNPRLEVHLLSECDFSAGDDIIVELMQFLRPEQKFENVEGLRSQIRLDCADALQWFADK